MVQVVDSTCGSDTEKLWIQDREVSVKDVDSVYCFNSETCGFQMLTSFVVHLCKLK